MKRFIAIFLALLMMAAVLPVPASAEESDDYEESEVPLPYDGALCGDHLSWAVEAGTLTISGTGDMYDFESETDVPWFESYTEIESIDLGPDVTGIGDYAFLGCTGVSVLTVPAGICRIGVYAFGSTVRILGVSGSAAETFSLENGNPFTPLISQPVITSLSNSVSGVTVTWSSSDDAQLYRIFRKSVSTDWMPLADTESCIYYDSSVESGTEYAYTVQCYSGDGLYAASSRNEDGVSITYIAAPPITGIAAVGGGVHITWEKVSGAVKYRVFRKAEGGTWTRIGDTAGTSITFGGAVKGTEYRYTVRCIDAAGNYVSSYYSNGTAFTMSDTMR